MRPCFRDLLWSQEERLSNGSYYYCRNLNSSLPTLVSSLLTVTHIHTKEVVVNIFVGQSIAFFPLYNFHIGRRNKSV